MCKVKSCPLQYKELPVSLTFPKNIPNCCKMPFKITEEDQETRQEVTASFAVAKEISTVKRCFLSLLTLAKVYFDMGHRQQLAGSTSSM